MGCTLQVVGVVGYDGLRVVEIIANDFACMVLEF